MKNSSTLLLSLALVLAACSAPMQQQMPSKDQETSSSVPEEKEAVTSSPAMMERMEKKDSAMEEKKASSSSASRKWSNNLTEDQIAVLRDGGTETPFTSPLVDEHRKGTFVSADCGEPVFRSEQKYDSGTGWPSFWAPIKPDALIEAVDNSAGIKRTEVRSKCGGHLGHVFSDGPEPTGLRYCINGLALRFVPDAEQ